MKRKLLACCIVVILLLTTLTQTFAIASSEEDSIDNKTISAGSLVSMVVKNDHTLWGFGNAMGGKLGIDVSEGAKTITKPTKIMDHVQSVSCGQFHTLIIKDDGSLWATGSNYYGNLGICQENIKFDEQLNLVPSNTNHFVKVMDNVIYAYAGVNTSFAITNDHSLWAWGDNEYGQLGNGRHCNVEDRNYTMMTYPVKIMDDVQSVSAGYNFTMILKQDGSLWAVGGNEAAQLGLAEKGTIRMENVYEVDYLSNPVKIMDNVVNVACGERHTLAVQADGSLWSWGANAYGCLGYGEIDPNNLTLHASDTPQKILTNVVQVSAASNYSLALLTDGSLYSFGINTSGQLGIGTEDQVLGDYGFIDPSFVALPQKILTEVSFVDAGIDHALAVKTDGSLWGWGDNMCGQLSNDATGNIMFSQDNSVQTYPICILNGVMLPKQGLMKASPNQSTILLDGKKITVDMYTLYDSNGGGSNYIKLRDLASLLSGSQAQFDVQWMAETSTIWIETDKPYTPVGGELVSTGTQVKIARPNLFTVYLNTEPIELAAYAIDGNNYLKLRDAGQKLNFNVSWSAMENTILIETDKPYSKD